MSRRRKATSTAVWLWLALSGLAIMVCLLPQPVLAQVVSGTILGTVKDSTGAMVAGAKVTLKNTDTGFIRTLVSDSKGDYTGPSLPSGPYAISVEKAGFKTVTLSNVRLGVDQRVRMDLTLEIGAVNETIQIEAAAPLLQTSSSDLSATINEVQIKSLPLANRNFIFLTRTIPGAVRGVPGENADGSAGNYGWRNSASFSANGQRNRDNNFLLDGVDNNELWLNTVVIFPNVDALEEFKVNTSNYAAEFGRSLGGIVNLQTKSGSNEFHGSGFEFMRNAKLDANDWFNNKNGKTRPPLSQHQFGGTLGGPIKKDKTFFFVDYQGWHLNQDIIMVSTVPTDKMRLGNFSELNKVIYDPLSPGTPFTNNTIPGGRIDPASRNIMDQLYPASNQPGTVAASGQVINNYSRQASLQRKDNQFDVKLDQLLSSKNRAFVRYSYEQSFRFLPAALEHGNAGDNASGLGTPSTGRVKAQSLAINDTHVFNESWINEFRFGWNKIVIEAEPIDYGKNLAQAMGIPGINLDQVSSAFVQMSWGGDIRSLGPSGNQPLASNGETYHFLDSVTHVVGRHTFKAGASVMFMRRDVLNAESASSQASFSNNMTSNCAGLPSSCKVIANTGFSVASFMLGYPNAWDRKLYSSAYTERRPQVGAFLQDDWRVSSKLTLNLGVRWELFVPYTTDNDLQSNFDTATGKFVVASPDAVVQGINVGRYLQTYSKGDFAPRIGFAYDVSGKGKTIIRGGFGMFWNNSLTGTSSSKAQNPPFLLSQSRPATYIPVGKLSDGLPALPIVDPTRPAAGATRSIFDVNFGDGYAQQWNLNVQQQLGKNYMFEIGYIGSRGRNLVIRKNVNQAPPIPGGDATKNRPFYAINPLLTDLNQNRSEGTLDYHGLLVRFNRRFANGLTISNSYTFSKAIDLDSSTDGNASFTNSYDYQYQRGPASYSVRHVFTSNWTYELPILRGKKLGGWQFSGIWLWRSGYPFTVGQTQNVTSTATGNRPDTIGVAKLDNPTIDQWFNVSAFAMPKETSATYGNTGRDTLFGPGQNTFDLSLVKATKFGRVDTELRLEAFNAFNHPAFGQPNATINGGGVGTITALMPLTPMRQIQLGLKLKF